MPTTIRYASPGVILALLLLASASGPASAQAQCPNSPTVTISSQLPSDVCIPAGFAGNPIAFFDDFSWRSFIAMVWPVQQGQRGVPDTGQSIGPASGPLVFETLKADWEVFQPSPDGGKSPPPAPSAWNSYQGQNPCSQFGVTNVGFGDMVLASFSKYGNLGEAGFGFLVGPLPAQNGTYTRYFTAFNQTEFEQILQQNLYLKSNIPASGVTFQTGAVDIKAAWIDMTNVQNPERFYTRTAWVMNPFTTPNPTCTEITVGLVGLHIVQKTPSRPQWIWSTFEQIDNVPPDTVSQGPFTYNNKNAPMTATSNPNSWPPTASPIVFDVRRQLPPPPPPPPKVVCADACAINPSTANTNKQYQAALQAKGGPWQYYQLVMTQWPLQLNPPQPIPPTQSGAPGNTFPGTNATSAFANVALETFDQTNIVKGCMRCHTGAQATTDFLWSLEVNAWQPGSTISPPSVPPRFARRPSPDADAALTAPSLSPPLAALKELMESAATP
jgi:hypothetical protein